ncbi:MAG TPA: transposase [Pirellulaceae bacterium]|nr:transposase [Pirellulaceae bacterium]
MAGAIPLQGRQRLRLLSEQLRTTVERHSSRWLDLQRMIFGEIERWLDRAQWADHFRRQDVAEMVVEAIEHRIQRGDWSVDEYTVMPTHIHLFCQVEDGELKAVLQDFKRWTGHRGSKILGVERKRFWQREWFDHWSRSDEEDERTVAYIRNNPVKAGLSETWELWPYRSRLFLPAGTLATPSSVHIPRSHPAGGTY